MARDGVAVITQALSADFFFPVWLQYYERQFGRDAIYIITEAGSRDQFATLGLGGVFTYPGNNFDDSQRSKIKSGIVQALLQIYKYVVVVDSDEIVLADPRRWSSLREFADQASGTYYTCTGYDLVQVTTEVDLDLGKQILCDQRKFAYATSSMCKTSMTRIPIQWGVGFHFASVYPRLGDLFLIHLKRSDVRLQLAWMNHMSGRSIPSELIKDYYKPDADKLASFVATVTAWPKASGWDDFASTAFQSRFLAEVALDERDSIYRGKHFTVPRLIQIPDEFRGQV